MVLQRLHSLVTI